MKKPVLCAVENSPKLVCDNPNCKEEYNTNPKRELKEYINVPCPNCGSNLLTEKDYKHFEVFTRTVKWINKWFFWIAYFTPKSKRKYVTKSYNHHDGTTTIKDID